MKLVILHIVNSKSLNAERRYVTLANYTKNEFRTILLLLLLVYEKLNIEESLKYLQFRSIYSETSRIVKLQFSNNSLNNVTCPLSGSNYYNTL